MYHCGTKPVLAHIANGMYGAIIFGAEGKTLPPVDNEYVLVEQRVVSERGRDRRARLAGHGEGPGDGWPHWVTFNGYANQYVTHPLTADRARPTRFWVVAAGPTNNVNFHVVGTLLDRAWVNSDLTQFHRNVANR